MCELRPKVAQAPNQHLSFGAFSGTTQALVNDRSPRMRNIAGGVGGILMAVGGKFLGLKHIILNVLTSQTRLVQGKFY